MTAAAVVERPARGGRPRDPEVDRRILLAGRSILADAGLSGFTADAVVAAAGVGKASLYRRWRTLEQLLVDVVRDLGVRPVDHGHGPGSLNADLARVLHAATSGRAARAELAVLSSLAHSRALSEAYLTGPGVRLITALAVAEARGRHRGEPGWRSMRGPLAGFRLLQAAALLGPEPTLVEAGSIVETVVLPALERSA